MNIQELCDLIHLPEGVWTQLKEYEESRKEDIPTEIKEQLFSRKTWAEGVENLKAFLAPDPFSIKILWEQMNFICSYSYEEYRKQNIPMQVFIDTFGFLTRFITPTRNKEGMYRYEWAWWLQRQITLQEFRIGSLEFEFVDNGGRRTIEIHIPSDANMNISALCESILSFIKFEEKYFSEWKGTSLITQTWMIMPELDLFLPTDSKIIQFKNLFDIDTVDYNQTWYMGWIFPGYSDIDQNLPEKTTLHRKLKKHLLDGGRFGIATGHIVLDRVEKVLVQRF